MSSKTPEDGDIIATLTELLERVETIRRTRSKADCGLDLVRLLRDIQKLKPQRIGVTVPELALLVVLQEAIREMAAGLGCPIPAENQVDGLTRGSAEIGELIREGVLDREIQRPARKAGRKPGGRQTAPRRLTSQRRKH